MAADGAPSLARGTRPLSWLTLASVTMINMAIVGITMPFLPVWFASRGLSGAEIAVVSALPLIVRLIANPAVAGFAERRGVIGGAVVACAMAAVLVIAAMTLAQGFLPILVGVAILALVQGPIFPLIDAITFAEIRRRAEAGEPRLDYGRTRATGSLGVFLATLFGGTLVGRLPPDGILWTSAAIGACGVLVSLQLASSTLSLNARKPEVPAGSVRQPFPIFVILVIAAAACVQASHAMLYTFASLHWVARGMSSGLVGLIWAVGVLTEAAFFALIGRFVRNERRALGFMFAGASVATIRWLCMSLDPSPEWLLALQFSHALTFAPVHLGSTWLLAALAPPGRRAEAQGWLSGAINISTAAVMTGLGLVYAGWGEAVYFAMSGLAFVGVCGVAAIRFSRRGAASAP